MESLAAQTDPGRPLRVTRAKPAYFLLAALIVGAALAALSLDVLDTNYGLKGDEATYVSMALSIADDFDVAYEREDIVRFYEVYGGGPEGIFLKRGRRLELARSDGFPWVALRSLPDDHRNRLYFGKAFIYPLVAAPFVRLAGLNGFWLLHVLLLGAVLVTGYVFLSARSPDWPSLLFVLAFIGASVTPLYGVYQGPDLFNFCLVFLGYFCWLYKEVAQEISGGAVGRFLRGRGSDVLAVTLLGLATYSKPLFILLAAPIVAVLWWRRQWKAGFLIGVLYVAVFAGAFGLNVVLTGEANYQGGERKTFYVTFPFQSRQATFETTGLDMTTNDPGDALDPALFLTRLRYNIVYFVAGRHFGFGLYCFPGLVVLALCAWRARTLHAWQVAGIATFLATAFFLLVMIPEAWSGGGGPVGNRYFIPVYAVLLFVVPPFEGFGPALAAWLGGSLFTAHILATPFTSAKATYDATERGAARFFPVELTMINDLPVQLDARRTRVKFGTDEEVLLYLLDEHAWVPEPPGMWIAAGRRADIIVRVYKPGGRLVVDLGSPVPNRATVAACGDSRDVTLTPGGITTVALTPSWALAPGGSHACVLSISVDRGFVPRLLLPDSTDNRYLGALIERLVVE